jgi:hypothetical protein
MLQLAARERTAHVDDALLAVGVAFLKSDPLRRPKAGRSGKQDHRPVARPDRRSECFEFRPSFERMLLLASPCRVVDVSIYSFD